MERTSVALADRLVSPSQAMLHWLRDAGQGAPRRPALALPSPRPPPALVPLAAA